MPIVVADVRTFVACIPFSLTPWPRAGSSGRTVQDRPAVVAACRLSSRRFVIAALVLIGTIVVARPRGPGVRHDSEQRSGRERQDVANPLELRLLRRVRGDDD